MGVAFEQYGRLCKRFHLLRVRIYFQWHLSLRPPAPPRPCKASSQYSSGLCAWSHCCRRFFQVEKEQEVEAFLRQATQAKQQLRVVGSALSPNGVWPAWCVSVNHMSV